MIKVAICDDEVAFVSQIEGYVLEICDNENIHVETEAFYSGESLEKELDKGNSYDLIFLDIQMANENGIEVAKKIRKTDDNVLLIYISGYDRYMIDLFRLDVFAFIKKPMEEELFTSTFLDAYAKICSKQFYFVYRYKNQEFKVPCKEILYFESSGRKIIIHKLNGQEVFNGKLNEVECCLTSGKNSFLRIHQSFLVNYHLIQSRSKATVKLTNGQILPISEERQKKFNQEYSKLLGGEICG